MSIEPSEEYNVLSQDRECKWPSKDHRPRPQNDVDTHMTITVKPEYPATQRFKKVIEIEYNEKRPSTMRRTIEVVPDKITINTEKTVVTRQVNLRTTSSGKKGQVIGAKAAGSSTSRKIKTRSKSQHRYLSDKDRPKFMEINDLSASVKPSKPLSRSLQAHGKMEENRLQVPGNNEESILGKSRDGINKINDVENDGYQRRNVACDGSQTSYELKKMQIEDTTKG